MQSEVNKTLDTSSFAGGEPLSLTEFGVGDGPTFLDELKCDSDNERLLDCPSLFFLSSCSQEDIGVRCNGKTPHTRRYVLGKCKFSL